MEIKSFIYLDEYKMYSVSSQIFEGLTEYVINYSSDNKEGVEAQKGPAGSGRLLADIINKETGKEEKKFLHDYSYTVFEKELFNHKKVLLIQSDNIHESIKRIDEYSFVKVVGRLLFNDIKAIDDLIKKFNEFGECITYITSFAKLEESNLEYNNVVKNTKDRNKKAAIKEKMKQSTNIKEIAKKNNLNYDQKLLDTLSFLLNYGYKDQLEVQIAIQINDTEKTIFSANLKRNYLKETEELVIKKHSRYSEKNFVIFGMITQNKEKTLESSIMRNVEKKELKEALVEMVSKLADIEDKFIGRLSNEIIIDPIAIYREL